jgi:tetratricopeptide (TPR) repeat protein
MKEVIAILVSVALTQAALAQSRPTVPLPPLETLESPVAEQLRQARRGLDEIATKPGVRAKDLADAYGSLARLYHAYQFFDVAEAAYLNAASLAPRDVRWLHLLAYVYQQTGRLQEAANKYVGALRAKPEDYTAAVHLGEVYLQLNRLGEAREQFEQIATRFPGVSSNGLGEIALREGRFEEAIRHLRAALEQAPQAASIRYSLAMAYRGLGRLDEARSQLQQRGPGGIRAVDPIVDELQTLVRSERLLVIQGRSAYEAGQFQNAADAFTRAIAIAPQSVTARVNLGSALARLGNADDAIKQFQDALLLEADNVEAHAGLGALLARQGRDADAVVHLQAAFAKAPGDANVTGELIRTLMKLQREDDAIDVLARARSFDPDDEQTVVSLAILLAHRERYREALTFIESANRRFPERAATATTLARLLASSPDMSLRDGRRALELAMSVYASGPTPAHAETVAIAMGELGRCDEAREWLRRAVADAERVKDRAEAARLDGEKSKYEGVSCRPPGR